MLTNQATGLISGRTPVSFHNTVGTVDNFGSIVSTAPTGTASTGSGVYLEFGGVLTNHAGGNITAQRAAVVVGGTTSSSAVPVTITNSGNITGSTGILIRDGDTAVNTITNYGTITGTAGVAIDLEGGTDRVVIESGSTLNGTVKHFTFGDSFDLPFLTYSGSATATLNAGNVLHVSAGSGSFDIALDPGDSFAGESFQLSADTTGGTLVTLATQNVGFSAPVLALNSFGGGSAAGGWATQDLYPRLVGDVNGDGLADIIGFGEAGVYEALGRTGGSFTAPALVLPALGAGAAAGGWTPQDRYPRLLGDVNGDGRADIVAFGEAGAYVALGQSNGSFADPNLGLNGFGAHPAAGGWTSQDQYPRILGDVNGDGRADIIAFGNGGTYTALGQADGTFAAPVFDIASFGVSSEAGGWDSNNTYPRLAGDVNGDHLADILGFGTAGVYLMYSQPA